jgi:hypothetical protein
METIFDHQITKKEVELLNSFQPSRVIKSKDVYLQNKELDRINADLYRLYTLRGDLSKADFFLRKIKDPTYKYLLSYF